MVTVGSLSRHTFRQLKFIVPGGVLTYYLQAHHALWDAYTGETDAGGWARTTATLALALGFLTFSLFMYILLVPIIKGEQPNFRHWRQSGVLSSVIPALTASIVSGWSILAYTLGRYSPLGYVKGTIGASGLYALSFGLMGLIPAPQVYRHGRS